MERVACKGEAGEGITKNFWNMRGVKIRDIKPMREVRKQVTGCAWRNKSSPVVKGWVRGAWLSTSGMTLAEPAWCSILKSDFCQWKTPVSKFRLLGGNTGKPLEIHMICDDGEFASKQIGSEMLKRMLDSKKFLVGGWPMTFHCCKRTRKKN